MALLSGSVEGHRFQSASRSDLVLMLPHSSFFGPPLSPISPGSETKNTLTFPKE
jgi:hypothetical protein